MGKREIDLGLTLTVKVPEGMEDSEILDLVFRACSGEGDPRNGLNMLANVNFAVQDQIESNIRNIGSPLEIVGSGLSVKIKGDNRTPRQRYLDEQKKS